MRVAALLFLAGFSPLFLQDYELYRLTLAGVYMMAVMGLALLINISGQFSIGHGAFHALGAYSMAVAMAAGVSAYVAIPIAALVGAVAGWLVGTIAGGVASLWGATPGGLLIQYLPVLARDASAALSLPAYGLILIGLMYLLPEGVVGLFRIVRGRVREKFRRLSRVGARSSRS